MTCWFCGCERTILLYGHLGYAKQARKNIKEHLCLIDCLTTPRPTLKKQHYRINPAVINRDGVTCSRADISSAHGGLHSDSACWRPPRVCACISVHELHIPFSFFLSFFLAGGAAVLVLGTWRIHLFCASVLYSKQKPYVYS